MMRTPACIAAFAMLMAACDTEVTAPAGHPPRFHLSTDRVSYRPGDSVRVTLHNVGDSTMAYTFCPHVFHRRLASGAWSDEQPLMICALIALSLAPGDSARITLRLDPSVAPGEYRAEFGMGAFVSPPFAVLGPPANSRGLPDSLATALWRDALELAIREVQGQG